MIPSLILSFLVTLSVIYESTAVDSTASFSISDKERATVQADRNFLINGVTRINLDNVAAGNMYVFGKNSFRVASTPAATTLWAATRMGYGKVCAFAHTLFCDMSPDHLKLDSNARVIQNCINWLTNNTSSAVGMITTDLAYNNSFVRSPKRSFTTLDDLKGVQFVVLKAHDNLDNSNKVAALKSFIQQGGGVFICATSWVIPDYLNFGGNQLLLDAGLAWVFNWDYSVENIGPENTPNADFWKTNPWYSSSLLLQQGTPTNPNSADLIKNYANLMPDTFPELDPNNAYSSKFVAMLGLPAIADKYCKVNFTFPLKKSDSPVQHACVKFIEMVKYFLPLNANHPVVKAASILPKYPSGNRASKTIMVTIPLNLKTKWQSTGVFVWPGSKLQITVPTFLVSADYKIQIGCHIDNLLDKDTYYRWPKVTSSLAITSATFNHFSLTGGLLYLDIGKLSANQQTANITFSGEIVMAPRFVLGKTSETEWAKSLAETTAPYGEVDGRDLVVTVLTSQLKRIQSITNLANWYDVVMSKYFDLSGASRAYKERHVVDVQISAGYGHSGYPIMMDDSYTAENDGTWTRSVITPTTDVSISGTYGHSHWGMFHELGHNFQKGPWTASGEGEVTNNIFSLYFGEIYPDGPYQFGERNFSPGERPVGNPEDPFYKLCFYIDLREAFGWEPFKQFFKYFELHPEIDKKNDTDVNDNWLKYFSQIVKRDITSLFTTYKKTVSDAAKKFASQFPLWNINKIVDCDKAAFPTSPCVSLKVESYTKLSFHMATWARINVTEALDISFKGTKPGNNTFEFQYDKILWNSVNFDQTTKILRMVPKKFIRQALPFDLQITTKNPLSFTDATIKIVDVKTSQIVHVQERSVEGITFK